jgi:D-alanyl-D-alanine carboxypeptidase
MAKKKRRNPILKVLKVVVVVYLLLVLGNLIGDIYSRIGNTHTIAILSEGNLVVVNHWNELPEDYDIELMELSNGQKIDERIYPYLQEMFNAARAEGIYPIVREGYRTEKEQQALYDEKVQAYINEGYSRSRAEKTAKEWVALPGTSEHQLGLAVDFNSVETSFENTKEFRWLKENAEKYGFVNRYPKNKTEITGINYEPWHYRYVGVENAKDMNQKGVCLEEYVK